MTERVSKLTMSVDEAAAELGVSLKTLYTLSRRADFPTVRIGRRIRISRAGLEDWVRAQVGNEMEGAT